MKIILFVSTLMISTLGFGQGGPPIEWQISLGGSEWDEAHSIQQTTDGGYIVAGFTNSNSGDVTGNHGEWDYWVVKLDAGGNITWQKSLGGTGWDEAHSIQQTTDGGYIVAGQSDSNDGDVTGNHGHNDYWIVKLNASGDITWQKSLGGSAHDWAESIRQTTDGGYIVTGRSASLNGDVTGNHGDYDYWVVKLDVDGNITWQKSLGGTEEEHAQSIQQTADGGYIIAGESWSNDGDVTLNQGAADFWIVKLDAAGNISWEKSLGGTEWDRVRSIQQTADEGYIIAGGSSSIDGDVSGNHGNIDYWVVKLDASGNITWQNSYGGALNDIANSVHQTFDGGYVVTGWAFSDSEYIPDNNGATDYWVIKLDTSGNMTWKNSYGGPSQDGPNSIQQTTDGGFIVAGYSSLSGGDVTGVYGNKDYWIVKLNFEASISKNNNLKASLYPNPTSNTFIITADKMINASFKIVDAQGKEVLSGKMNGKEQSIDISSLSKGTYSIVFEDEELPVLSVIKE